jgi:hypothetical protein
LQIVLAHSCIAILLLIQPCILFMYAITGNNMYHNISLTMVWDCFHVVQSNAHQNSEEQEHTTPHCSSGAHNTPPLVLNNSLSGDRDTSLSSFIQRERWAELYSRVNYV